MAIDAEKYELLSKDRTNLWDQLCELVRLQKWTTQDLATTSLLREMNNVTSLFMVRKADGVLIGAAILVETAELVMGVMYVMREGYRGSGLGMQLMRTFKVILRESLKRKPLIVRGVKSMMGKYSGRPFLADKGHEMYSFQLNRPELLKLFPAPTRRNRDYIRVRDLTPRQFQQLIDYDRMVTGVNRTTFLQNYFSLSFVEGVVLFDHKNRIIGMAGIVPTPAEAHLYKLNPIYAANKDDAAWLARIASDQVKHPEAKFVCHVRTESAGEWILQKCRDKKVALHYVGAIAFAMDMNQPYIDPSRTELIYAPTNSPAHFDG